MTMAFTPTTDERARKKVLVQELETRFGAYEAAFTKYEQVVAEVLGEFRTAIADGTDYPDPQLEQVKQQVDVAQRELDTCRADFLATQAKVDAFINPIAARWVRQVDGSFDGGNC